MSDQADPKGLVITVTEQIRNFLNSVSTHSTLSQDLRDLASILSSQTTAPYKSLRTIWIHHDPNTRPELTSLFSGSDFVFTSPKPREKNEELKARLRKLEEMAERNAYEALVKDITPRKRDHEPFSSYKDQLGFGVHVVLIMFTGFLIGFAAFRALFSHSPAMSAAGGILGLVFGMLVETFLFIIKSSSQELGSSTSTSKAKKNQ